MAKEYKTTRKFGCPYCELKATRNELITHVEKVHQDMIPEDYTAARSIYDHINGKDHGICMICKEKVYKWNDKCNRYYNLCDKKECREKVRENALKNHIRVYNKPSLLDDPEHQQKMLANRKISGTYTFTDGGKLTYTGTYEKKALEFIDKVLEIPSRDIQTPGPILEYEYNGKKHFWITDIYYIPANLLIEVKDGGSNPNNRSMTSYREKQVAKEEMVTELGTFNYIRLTNNDFSQLLDIMAEMKMVALESDGDPKKVIKINEEVGGIPPHHAPEAYIIPYGMNNVFSGFAYTDSDSTDVSLPDSDTIKSMSKKEFFDKYNPETIMVYDGDDKEEKISEITNSIIEMNFTPHPAIFIEMLTGKRVNSIQDVLIENSKFKFYNRNILDKVNTMIEAAVTDSVVGIYAKENVLYTDGYVYVARNAYGYYAYTIGDTNMKSDYFSSLEDLKDSGSIDLMKSVIDAKHEK